MQVLANRGAMEGALFTKTTTVIACLACFNGFVAWVEVWMVGEGGVLKIEVSTVDVEGGVCIANVNALAPAEGDDLDDATPLIALRGKRSSDRAVAGVFADVTCIVALKLWICGFKDL